MSARVTTDDGQIVATIDLVDVGGGVQTVYDPQSGTPQECVHPQSTVYHVRLLSPDRMLADELREVATYEEATELGQRYADKVAANAGRLAEIAQDLKAV